MPRSAGGTNTFSCASATTITVSATKTVSKNTVLDGGGLLTIDGSSTYQVFSVNSGVTATFQSLTIANGNNPGSNGGGIYNNGTLNVINSTFSGNNAAGGSGGGIYNNGTLNVTNSTFSSNVAYAGGGIFNSGTLTVTNSTFSSNGAIGGGGILNSGMLTVTNSTFCGNSTDVGGGIFNIGTLNLANTIIANSTSGGDCVNGGTIGTNDHNLIMDGSCTPAVSGDPKLGPLQNNGGPTQTMALLLGSLAIGAGDSTTCTNPPVSGKDQRAFARVTCDIGAYANGTKGNTTTTLSGSSGNFTPPQTFTFTATVAQAVTKASAPSVKPGVRAPSQTGTVTFYDNNVAIPTCTNVALNASHQATCTITLGAGNHVITAIYNGDTFYITSTSNALTLTLTFTPSEVPEGDTLILFGSGLGGFATWLGWQRRRVKHSVTPALAGGARVASEAKQSPNPK